MHRNDNSNYFLYIEPTIEEKSLEPINDIYTKVVQYFFDNATLGVISAYDNLSSNGDVIDFRANAGYKGFHRNCDGTHSSNCDFLFSNGYITNSLCVHYVRWFRGAITGANLIKLENLKDLYIRIKNWKQDILDRSL